MKINLPLVEPLLKSYSKYAIMSSIVGTKKELLPWVFYNYWQLVGIHFRHIKLFWIDCGSTFSPYFIREFKALPCLLTNAYHREHIKQKHLLLSEFCIEELHKGNYLYFISNKKYVKAYNCNEDSLHEMMISGFDENEDTFICYDFFGDFFSSTVVSREEIDNSFFSIDDELLSKSEFAEIYSLVLQDPKIYSIYDIEVTKEMMMACFKYILEPMQSDIGKVVCNIPDISLGLNVYDRFREKIENNEISLKDVRPLYIFKDHIHLLAETGIHFGLCQNEDVYNIENKIASFCSMVLKYNLKGIDLFKDKSYLNKVFQYLSELKMLEENYLRSCLK